MNKHSITSKTLPLHRLSKAQGHKFSHGHALVLCGGPGRTGAGRLAARGALRVGAGLVTLGVPPKAMREVAAQVTAIMQHTVEDRSDLDDLLRDERFNAVCVGPGLGLDGAAADLVRGAIQSGRAAVLDADALSLVARDPALFSTLHPGCILTPHSGEFARLFPDLAEHLCSDNGCDKAEVATRAAKRSGCVVLLKGEVTVVAQPDGEVGVHCARGDRAAPWLATAGAGDVLAGFIAGLLARGFAPAMAAEVGAFLHVEAARLFGPGLVAEDLPEQLPEVFRQLAV